MRLVCKDEAECDFPDELVPASPLLSAHRAGLEAQLAEMMPAGLTFPPGALLASRPVYCARVPCEAMEALADLLFHLAATKPSQLDAFTREWLEAHSAAGRLPALLVAASTLKVPAALYLLTNFLASNPDAGEFALPAHEWQAKVRADFADLHIGGASGSSGSGARGEQPIVRTLPAALTAQEADLVSAVKVESIVWNHA